MYLSCLLFGLNLALPAASHSHRLLMMKCYSSFEALTQCRDSALSLVTQEVAAYNYVSDEPNLELVPHVAKKMRWFYIAAVC